MFQPSMRQTLAEIDSTVKPLRCKHKPLAESYCVQFSKWLDSQLPELENRFSEYMTPSSLKTSSR